jgi:hypothetical protein
MRQLFTASLAAATLLLCLPATAVVIDFAHGMPAGSVVSGKNLTTAGYQFSGDAAAPAIDNIYVIRNVPWGTGLVAPAAGHSLTVSRPDHLPFDLASISTFVGGIIVTGATDFEVTPFNAQGVEGQPVAFSVLSPFDQVLLGASTYPTLMQMSSFKVAASMVTAFTALTLTSAADVAVVPELASAWMLCLGLAAVGALRWRRRA